ncbi:MAG: ABC transporter permease [Candidatus Pristimantibacillus lignocellulolyticus]|uniref:Putative hemin transport system permease protein HrtB n=1 Tax=Candidatus Pristimantibacillus lignocellulolyticus TaxID=2994561 RepID=A0A9J6ZI21_9BACL|nr:MAG: ABC transporter permease [Candidatus Pristimantibacillus lignocellulolyticus]
MNMAWKEIKKSKAKFVIVGSIIFLISFLTFIISGLANGLSQDNSALVKSMPQGHFYMNSDANDTYNLSKIDSERQEELLSQYPEAFALSIQMGFVNDENDKQHGVAFVAATESDLFPTVQEGEIILNSDVQEDGITLNAKLTNEQFSGQFSVVTFADEQKFSHADVAFIHEQNYKEMYRTNSLQMIFIPGDEEPVIEGMVSFSNSAFLNTLASYKAEQMTLNMIIWFLIAISGLLFAIFFYMMNVQKIGLYGILKAIGVKTSTLFRMMWAQMIFVTVIALIISISASQLFNAVAPAGMPFHLTIGATIMLSILFLIIGFIGATISGIQIKKVEPLQAIQQGEM